MFGLFRGKKGKGAGQGGGEGAAAGPPDLSRITEPGPAFFVPGLDDRREAEARLQEIRQRLAGPLKAEVAEPAFAAIAYHHDQDSYRAEVGQIDPRLNETVRAILRQDAKSRFLILTARHGFDHGLPLIVADREVTQVIAFRDA
jgi:hypothetical protein